MPEWAAEGSCYRHPRQALGRLGIRLLQLLFPPGHETFGDGLAMRQPRVASSLGSRASRGIAREQEKVCSRADMPGVLAGSRHLGKI
jgi:hypothetical protein